MKQGTGCFKMNQYPYRAKWNDLSVTVLRQSKRLKKEGYVIIEFDDDGMHIQVEESKLQQADQINPHNPPRTFRFWDAHCGIWVSDLGLSEIAKHQHVHSDNCACVSFENVMQWATETIALKRHKQMARDAALGMS